MTMGGLINGSLINGSKQLGTIEPVFGNITVNKDMNKFTLCGQEKVNIQ
jgi:hypothetical protein